MPSSNPFSHFRAENMGDELWKYYVPGPFDRMLTPRPLVIEGGRGSGKTMLFLCNAWRQQLAALDAFGESLDSLVGPGKSVGLYYRVDAPFVTAMEGDAQNWAGVFNTYLGVCIVREALQFIEHAVRRGFVQADDLRQLLGSAVSILREPVSAPDDVAGTVRILEDVLDNIEEVVNDQAAPRHFRPTLTGSYVAKFVDRIRQLPKMERVTFRVFIDEYEALLEYQQRQVNTLIKQSSSRLIYNIGLRPRGMITPRTVGPSEIIQQPHDFHFFSPELALNPEDGDSSSEYSAMLQAICEKRFDMYAKSHSLQAIPTDIEFYLGRYSVDEEIRSIISAGEKRGIQRPFMPRLTGIIRDLEPDPVLAEKFIKELAEDPPVLNARLHLCVLLRSLHYRPALSDLADAYRLWDSAEGQLEAKRDRLGVDAMRAADHDRVLEFVGATGKRLAETLEIGDDDIGCLDHQR